jgi:uncharacterized protein YodC (DUF2158 family)
MAKSPAPGDVVRLKSGGPEMTIESVDDGIATCVWFPTDESVPSTTKFRLLVLVRIDD